MSAPRHRRPPARNGAWLAAATLLLAAGTAAANTLGTWGGSVDAAFGTAANWAATPLGSGTVDASINLPGAAVGLASGDAAVGGLDLGAAGTMATLTLGGGGAPSAGTLATGADGVVVGSLDIAARAGTVADPSYAGSGLLTQYSGTLANGGNLYLGAALKADTGSGTYAFGLTAAEAASRFGLSGAAAVQAAAPVYRTTAAAASAAAVFIGRNGSGASGPMGTEELRLQGYGTFQAGGALQAYPFGATSASPGTATLRVVGGNEVIRFNTLATGTGANVGFLMGVDVNGNGTQGSGAILAVTLDGTGLGVTDAYQSLSAAGASGTLIPNTVGVSTIFVNGQATLGNGFATAATSPAFQLTLGAGFSAALGQTFDILLTGQGRTTGGINGFFDYGGLLLGQGGTIVLGGYTFAADYGAGVANAFDLRVTAVPVPEPGSGALLAGAALAALLPRCLRRERRP